MPKTPIANGAEALIVSAREAQMHDSAGVIPSGGQRRCTVLCYVPSMADLRDTLRAAIGEAAPMPPLTGFSLRSMRARYVVRIERMGRNGKALAPSYKTPLAGTLIPAPPVKAKTPAKASTAPSKGAKPSAPTTVPASTLQAASQSTASISQGSAVANKRGQGR